MISEISYNNHRGNVQKWQTLKFQIRIEAWEGSGDRGNVVLDDVSFIQTQSSKEIHGTLKLHAGGNGSSPTTSSLTNSSETSTVTKKQSKGTTLDGAKPTSTSVVSPLYKATFPFPCYLDMVRHSS